MADIPNEVAEPENQDGNSSELYCVRKGTVEGHNVVAKHGREGQWSKALHECNKACRHDCCHFPGQRPIQRIVLIVGRLGYKYSLRFTLDEVVSSDVGHKLSAWEDIDVELLFDGMEHLHSRLSEAQSHCPRHKILTFAS